MSYRIEVYAYSENRIDPDTHSEPANIHAAQYKAEDLLTKGYPSVVIHLVQL